MCDVLNIQSPCAGILVQKDTYNQQHLMKADETQTLPYLKWNNFLPNSIGYDLHNGLPYTKAKHASENVTDSQE